jgi:hypothetical protein
MFYSYVGNIIDCAHVTNSYRKHQVHKASKDIFATKWVHFRVRQAENWPPFRTIVFSNSFLSTDERKEN